MYTRILFEWKHHDVDLLKLFVHDVQYFFMIDNLQHHQIIMELLQANVGLHVILDKQQFKSTYSGIQL